MTNHRRRVVLASMGAFVLALACGEGVVDPSLELSDDEAENESGLVYLPADVYDAGFQNLRRVEHDLDTTHLGAYRYTGTPAERFRSAFRLEYGYKYADLYRRKAQVLASIVFLQAPHLLPPPNGRRTVFHGMDLAGYGRLIDMENAVWSRWARENGGSSKGLGPFSVCETRYLIDRYVKVPGSMAFAATVTFTDASWSAYRAGYASYSASCPAKDTLEWFNYRGLGKLRPSWLESNVMDRFLRRERQSCRSSTTSADCKAWFADPLGYRERKNLELARRMFLYAPEQQTVLGSTSQPAVIVEDRTGDGVGELITQASTFVASDGGVQTVTITATSDFSGKLNAAPSRILASSAVHPGFDPAVDLPRADLGLLRLFPNGAGCGETGTVSTCPLLNRFYTLINRHEDFYRTYTSLYPSSTSIGTQPSPLVANSITLGAADWWANNSPSGTQGFVFVERIPFADIVAGVPLRVTTSGVAPVTRTLADLYAGRAALDFGSAWLDIASLSSNLYASEHEISKFGYVRAGQIEGILYIGVPAVVP
jgi:hypothetical protein